MSVIPTSIIIPLADNDGQLFPEDRFLQFENRLLPVAGGFTRRDNVIGAWQADDGTVYRDRSFEYEVSLGSWRQVGNFVTLAEYARIEFLQEAIYIEIAGIPEILQ